jgi:putative endonuclease
MRGRDLGTHGEQLAAEHLRRLGYRIVAQNQRSRWGEIDLIAQDGDEIVFVEVKTRRVSAAVGPEEAMTRAKLHRVEQLAMAYLDEHELEGSSWRVEVVSIETRDDGSAPRLRLHQDLL